jgi:hypothetical protein
LSDFTGISPENSRKMGLNSQKTRKNLLLKNETGIATWLNSVLIWKNNPSISA